jgi:hypothetical protein
MATKKNPTKKAAGNEQAKKIKSGQSQAVPFRFLLVSLKELKAGTIQRKPIGALEGCTRPVCPDAGPQRGGVFKVEKFQSFGEAKKALNAESLTSGIGVVIEIRL